MSPDRGCRAHRRGGRALFSLAQPGLMATLLLIIISGAKAENLDAGKTGARLFAESCASCHRTPRELAKGRFRLTLYLFLQQHYTSSSDSASALSSYLQSVDTPADKPARGARTSRTVLREGRPPRPPLPVRGR